MICSVLKCSLIGLTSVKEWKDNSFQISEIVPHENDTTNTENWTLHSSIILQKNILNQDFVRIVFKCPTFVFSPNFFS